MLGSDKWDRPTATLRRRTALTTEIRGELPRVSFPGTCRHEWRVPEARKGRGRPSSLGTTLFALCASARQQ
jgi:hypothetical protein